VTYKEVSLLLDTYPEVKQMRDRTGRTPVKTFINYSYVNGLPLFKDYPEINREVIMCLGYVLYKIINEKVNFRDLQYPLQTKTHFRTQGEKSS